MSMDSFSARIETAVQATMQAQRTIIEASKASTDRQAFGELFSLSQLLLFIGERLEQQSITGEIRREETE